MARLINKHIRGIVETAVSSKVQVLTVILVEQVTDIRADFDALIDFVRRIHRKDRKTGAGGKILASDIPFILGNPTLVADQT